MGEKLLVQGLNGCIALGIFLIIGPILIEIALVIREYITRRGL